VQEVTVEPLIRATAILILNTGGGLFSIDFFIFSDGTLTDLKDGPASPLSNLEIIFRFFSPIKGVLE
jgi:hypothetical protein